MTTRKMLLSLSLLLSGCASSATEPGRLEQYTGFFSQGFEVESFEPCGSDQQWWVTGGQELRTRYQAVATQPYQRVYVKVRAEVGPEGKYGHLGAYSREIAVEEVLEIRAAREGDCR